MIFRSKRVLMRVTRYEHVLVMEGSDRVRIQMKGHHPLVTNRWLGATQVIATGQYVQPGSEFPIKMCSSEITRWTIKR